MKTIYFVRHSGPFVDIEDYYKMPWSEVNKNMILSSQGEENAKRLCSIEELKNIDEIYSSNSARAIATAKYISEINNLKISIDNRINERNFGIEYISDLPENFNKKQFEDRNLKYKNGESLNELSERFNSFIKELLSSDKSKIALVIHGICLMNYLSEICNVEFDGQKFKVIYDENVILDGRMSNPDIYKIEFNNENNIINVERVIVESEYEE